MSRSTFWICIAKDFAYASAADTFLEHAEPISFQFFKTSYLKALTKVNFIGTFPKMATKMIKLFICSTIL